MNTNSKLQTLIDQVTRKAYENVVSGMGTDPDIAAQLRDGLRTVVELFNAIENNEATPEVLLNHMLAIVQKVLSHYQSLPGSQGEWECSAVGMVEREIIELLQNTTKLTSWE